MLLTADEALNSGSKQNSLAEACAWLEAALADGATDASRLFELASQDGISERTLRRAKDQLGVESNRGGFGPAGGWQWSLPRPAP